MKTIKVKVDVIPDKPKEKLPHYKEIELTKDMAEGTRAFAEQYNAMRAALLEHKLMRAK